MTRPFPGWRTPGFCRALYLVDRGSGRTASETVWQDAQALACSRGAAAAMRAEAVYRCRRRHPRRGGVHPRAQLPAQALVVSRGRLAAATRRLRSDYEEIINVTSLSSGCLDRDAAERALQATLQTLAERLPRGEAQHILRELQAELKPWIYIETDAEGFGIDEFLHKVADASAPTSTLPCGIRGLCSPR